MISKSIFQSRYSLTYVCDCVFQQLSGFYSIFTVSPDFLGSFLAFRYAVFDCLVQFFYLLVQFHFVIIKLSISYVRVQLLCVTHGLLNHNICTFVSDMSFLRSDSTLFMDCSIDPNLFLRLTLVELKDEFDMLVLFNIEDCIWA
jgi:uncharacterized membrane protein YfhO